MNSTACRYYTERTLGWMLNNKMIVFLSLLSFSLFVSTLAIAGQRNRLATELEELKDSISNSPESTPIPTTPEPTTPETEDTTPPSVDTTPANNGTSQATGEPDSEGDTTPASIPDPANIIPQDTREAAEEARSRMLNLMGYVA